VAGLQLQIVILWQWDMVADCDGIHFQLDCQNQPSAMMLGQIGI
jgi:hypothetical protein